MASDLEQLTQVFQSYNVPFSPEWLRSCIEWCKKESLPPSHTFKELQMQVYKQWLFTDLKHISVPMLPRNLSNEKKFLLTGCFCLQLKQVVDISKPKLWQIQRIRNNAAKNTESDNDYGKRVLQLSLTDGVQSIEAMEFKPVQCLSINLAPGIKIKITGPVMVRNGRIMLENQNVKILGGLVDEFKVNFAAENVLARALGLKENPKPISINEHILEINQDTQNQTTTYIPRSNQLNQKQNASIPNQVTPKISDSTYNRCSNVVKKQTIILPEFELDDELLKELQNDDEELDLPYMDNKKSNSKLAPDKKKKECKSPDLFGEMDIDEDLLNEQWENMDIGCNIPTVERTNKSSKPKESVEVISLDDSFENIDIDSHLDKIDQEMQNLPSSTQIPNIIKNQITSPELMKKSSLNPSKTITPKLLQTKINFNTGKNDCVAGSSKTVSSDVMEPTTSPKMNVMSIEKLKKLQPKIGKGNFKIKARFKEVVEKMGMENHKYNLVIKVEDSSDDLIVRVDSSVVEYFVGVSPETIEALKELVYQNDENAKTEIIAFLKKLHQACISLDDVLQIQITRGEDYPLLAKIIK